MPDDQIAIFIHALLALAIGLLIGLERGWQNRNEPQGSRVAGVRTFALLGLGGALWWHVGEAAGSAFLGLSFLGIVGLLSLFYALETKIKDNDISVTSLVAAVLIFLLGALAMQEQANFAAAAAVAVAIILGIKQQIHGFLQRISRVELMAVLKLLVITVILLPLLPNEGMGPYDALNPFLIWLLVVFIVGISFVGYVAIRVFGNRRGVFVASLAGGLVSSTAVTLAWARAAQQSPGLSGLFASGVVIACAVMFLRVLAIIAVLAPTFAKYVALPLVVAAVVTLLAGAMNFRRAGQTAVMSDHLVITNPFEIWMALKMGALLAAVMLALAVAQNWLGDIGIFLLAFLSGLLDVDAASASVARQAGEMRTEIAALAIGIAVASNSFFKSAAAFAIGGSRMGIMVSSALLVAICAAALVLAAMLWR
jgi:uncharacterized membrane protein (DUF4010 family)